MKFTEMIKYLKDRDKLEKLFEAEKPNTEPGAILICMENPLDISAAIKLFEMEETDGDLVFEKEGVSYTE